MKEEIIAPKSTPRKGPEPYVYKADSFMDEMKKVCATIQRLHRKHHVPYDEMAILYRVKKSSKQNYISIIQRQLAKNNLPFYWVAENQGTKKTYSKDDGKIKISTIDSSKGLDFQAVFIVNVDNIPFELEKDKNREAALLYIAMTRAHKFLSLSFSGESEYTQFLEEMNERFSQDSIRADSS